VEGILLVIPDETFLGYEDALDLKPIDSRIYRKEADHYIPKENNNFLNTKVALSRGDTFMKGSVARRKHAPKGTPQGIANRNPILDIQEYEIDFVDRNTETYAINLISENLYSQVDAEGHEILFLDYILEHKKDGSAVSKDDQYMSYSIPYTDRRLYAHILISIVVKGKYLNDTKVFTIITSSISITFIFLPINFYVVYTTTSYKHSTAVLQTRTSCHACNNNTNFVTLSLPC
jgi:hypothetical protein